MKNQLIVSREILIYAFRYAIGRESVAPDNVITTIKNNIESISDNDIELYIREIDESNYYGMEFDQEGWKNFKRYLKDILDKRNGNL